MKILMALYKTPADVDAFLARYHSHLLLVDRIPGLLKVEITKITQTLAGEQGNFLLAQMYFADADSFKVALESAETAAAGADAMEFAPGLFTLMTGETVEI